MHTTLFFLILYIFIGQSDQPLFPLFDWDEFAAGQSTSLEVLL